MVEYKIKEWQTIANTEAIVADSLTKYVVPKIFYEHMVNMGVSSFFDNLN